MRPIDWWSQYKKSMQVWKGDRRMNQLIKESISDSLTPKLIIWGIKVTLDKDSLYIPLFYVLLLNLFSK